MKTCSSCGQELDHTKFYRRTTGKLESRCKRCFISAQAEGIEKRSRANMVAGDMLRENNQVKICSGCGEEKSYMMFNRQKKNPDGHANSCTACSRPYAKKYYEANRERLRDSQTASLVESIRVKREYLAKYYSENPCVGCGTTNLLVLQSDHQGDQKYEIARLVNSGHSLQVLVEELQKCVTRCANCHQVETAKAFGFWRLEYV